MRTCRAFNCSNWSRCGKAERCLQLHLCRQLIKRHLQACRDHGRVVGELGQPAADQRITGALQPIPTPAPPVKDHRWHARLHQLAINFSALTALVPGAEHPHRHSPHDDGMGIREPSQGSGFRRSRGNRSHLNLNTVRNGTTGDLNPHCHRREDDSTYTGCDYNRRSLEPVCSGGVVRQTVHRSGLRHPVLPDSATAWPKR